MLLWNLRLLIDDPAAFFLLVAIVGFSLLIAITVHEFSHALMANRLGDPTAKRMGRLSLNPIKHLDPLGTLMLLLVGFGWGKPVPINPNYFRMNPRRGMAVSALAGPLSNFALAAVLGVIIRTGVVAWHSPYEGLTFIKERYGDVQVYHYSYVTEISSGRVRVIDVFIRGNPAENEVPIDSKIIYPTGKNVYLSINSTEINMCEDTMIAIAGLSGFLANNEIPLKAGTPDREESKRNNSTYLTCASYPSSLTISLKAGEETKITRTGNCYNIEVSNCEILPALEKFIVQSIVDAKNSAN